MNTTTRNTLTAAFVLLSDEKFEYRTRSALINALGNAGFDEFFSYFELNTATRRKDGETLYNLYPEDRPIAKVFALLGDERYTARSFKALREASGMTDDDLRNFANRYGFEVVTRRSDGEPMLSK